MINKLKRKFTVLATVSTVILITVLLAIMNILNFCSLANESDTVLKTLSKINNSALNDLPPPERPADIPGGLIPRGMSPEVPYESRYFTVTVTADGEIKDSDMSKIVSVDEKSVTEYIEKAIGRKINSGFINQFRYLKTAENQMTKILFLDCGRKLDSFYTFLWTSFIVGIFGCVAVFAAFLFASGKIVKPIAESYNKQRLFISDAGHEIKTPLTVINANIDLLECDIKREELNEIKNQTKRLTELTENLIYLSKTEEMHNKLPKIEIPLSDIVCETSESFKALTDAKNIAFTVKSEPQITICGSPDMIRQLVSVLLQNAVKYAPNGGIITLNLKKHKKQAILSVFNTTETEISPADLPYVFDRFYRSDASRNSETGGHGIGLSIAKAITDEHSGSIKATTENGFDFCITVTLPL